MSNGQEPPRYGGGGNDNGDWKPVWDREPGPGPVYGSAQKPLGSADDTPQHAAQHAAQQAAQQAARQAVQQPYGTPGQPPYALGAQQGWGAPPPAPPARSNGTLWAMVGVGCGLFLVAISCIGGMGYAAYRKAREAGGGVLADVQRQIEDMDRRRQRGGSIAPRPPAVGPSSGAGVQDREPDATLVIEARVTEIHGTSLHVGDSCNFNVQRIPRSDGSFWCNAQAVCGGQLLFGGARMGYFSCTWYEQPNPGVVGNDDETSGQNGRVEDAAFSINTIDRVLHIHDDARGTNGEFRLSAEISSVEAQEP